MPVSWATGPTGSPPHRRGKAIWGPSSLWRVRITPAWAGKSRLFICFHFFAEDHPRMGREKRLRAWPSALHTGSPPHGRGKVYFGKRFARPARITPAWAGKSEPIDIQAEIERDHPRMGGEKISFFFTGCSPKGSPPHGRGKGSAVRRRVCVPGITPAWAGKSPRYIRQSSLYRDHPRMGGEKPLKSKVQVLQEGSPPHGRGKVKSKGKAQSRNGITPAWAGKRYMIT